MTIGCTVLLRNHGTVPSMHVIPLEERGYESLALTRVWEKIMKIGALEDIPKEEVTLKEKRYFRLNDFIFSCASMQLLPLLELTEDFLQLFCHCITNLSCRRGTANVFSSDTFLNRSSDGFLDGLGFGWKAEGVLQHHGSGQDGAHRVDDTLARNIWRGP